MAGSLPMPKPKACKFASNPAVGLLLALEAAKVPVAPVAKLERARCRPSSFPSPPPPPFPLVLPFGMPALPIAHTDLDKAVVLLVVRRTRLAHPTFGVVRANKMVTSKRHSLPLS